MNDETVAVLREIADLLRERVNQEERAFQNQQEAVRESRERFADLAKLRADYRLPGSGNEAPGWDEFRKRMEERATRASEVSERLKAEDREFRQRLLAELARHNSLIERLILRQER